MVCSPQGHVGATLTARLLLDFYLSQDLAARGFDTNRLDPGLSPVFPKEVDLVDLSSTRGQMVLFDSLIENDHVTKVVDLWHVSYGSFFKQANDLGLFKEMQDRNIKCFIFLLLDSKYKFSVELSTLPRRCIGADIIPTENATISYLYQSEIEPSLEMPRRRLVIPRLDPVVHQLLMHPEILIYRFINMVVPQELRHLQEDLHQALLPIFKQFEIIEVAAELGLPVRSLLSQRNI